MASVTEIPAGTASVETHADQVDHLLQFQRDALEMIAVGRPTDDILDGLCRLAEAMVPNSVASIMLLDADRAHLWVRAAPSIPADGIDALNGLQPGPFAGSCGTAVFNEQPVFVNNVLSDARWARLIDIAERFNLQACWSMPIRSASEQVIGSFALTSFKTRPPEPFHERLLDTASYLAGIVLEREQHAENLATAAVAFDHMREAVMVTDNRNCIVQVNRAFERITGFAAEEAIGQTPKMLRSGHQDALFYSEFYRALEQQGEWRGEIWNRRKNGDVYPQWLSVRIVRDDNGEVHRYVSVFADITDIKESERKLWQLAHHDALSQLPNRLMLGARLDHAVQRAHRHGERVALLFIDLDRFKNVNDSLGHQVGDELLKEVAGRLVSSVHEDDTVARLGGDEFVILLEDIPHANAALRVAERLLKRLGESLVVADRTLFVTASIGISLYPEDAETPDLLLQHADAAMYRAKALGRNRAAFYAPELTRDVQQRLELEHGLRNALARNEFVVHYQPQFAASSGRLVGIEALVRWQHPQRGLVPPNEFIPVAEESGLIDELGCWVTKTACRQARAWRDMGYREFMLAVNLSPYQLGSACSSRLASIFEQVGFPREYFEFEVTESLFVEQGGMAMRQLRHLREQLGIGIAMDDFGTGHSSLSQLKQLPISKLKIDRSFVTDLPNDANDAAIVRAIILMAKTLGLTIVAEGVETEAQRAFLRECGCDHMQGYLFARPMPAAEITRLFSDTGITDGNP
ncbi:MAG: EAL domain-containing protein [Gammaproteobacteria bacterium]|nr:EAL domain-containing protein [Gammaproteobacteria bacterium]